MFDFFFSAFYSSTICVTSSSDQRVSLTPAAISAEPARLAEIGGVGNAMATILKIVQAVALRLTREQVVEDDVIKDWRQIPDCMRARLAYKDTEEVCVLYLMPKGLP